MVEAKFKHLKVALAKAEADSKPLRAMLDKVEANLASKKARREAEVVKAREKLVEIEKKVAKRAMEAYKASMEFSAEKAGAVEIFRTSKEFYNDHHQFSKEAFQKGFKLG